MKKNQIYTAIGALIAFVGFIVLIGLLLGFPVMLLWNVLMPAIFGLPTISFWQALGLNILSGIFFKSSTSTSSK